MDLLITAAPHQDLAEEIARRLASAADRLNNARDLEAFVAALDQHRQVWLIVSQSAPKLGWLIPEQLIEISLSTAGRADGRLDDQEIESLIRINRFASLALAKACAEAAESGENKDA